MDPYWTMRTDTGVRTLFTEMKMTLTIDFKIGFTFCSGGAFQPTPDSRLARR